MKTFEKGSLVFSISGHAGRYHAAIEGAGHLVAPIWEETGEEGGEHEGDPTLWKECFATEPEPKLGPQIAARQKELDDIYAKLTEARTSLNEATRTARENLSMLAKLQGQSAVFKRADLLFDGKINFVVTKEQYGHVSVRIISKDDRASRCGAEATGSREFKYEPLRLLSLWGKRNGDYGFFLHTYSDGSGNGGCPCEPFETKEEADEYALKLVLSLIEEKRKANSDTRGRAEWSHYRSLKALGKADLYPPELLTYLQGEKKRQADENFRSIERQYLEAKAARESKVEEASAP